MVASRRKPTAPAASLPRTNSAQASTREPSTRPTDSNPLATSDSNSNPLQSSNNNIPNGATKSKSNQKSKKPKSRATTDSQDGKRSTFVDRLFLFLLATFVAYALYICPSDINHESSVCRSLASYRSYVLEPYVVPPIRAAITHPVVQQPYEKYAKPVYVNYIQPITPYISAAHRHTAPYLNTAVNASKRSALRVWNKIIIPYWTRAIVPRYHLYIQPHVNKYVSPITKRINHYNHKAEPYVRAFVLRIAGYSGKAQEHILAVYVKVKPYAVRTYGTVKPYAIHAYAKIKPFLWRAMREVQVRGHSIAGEVIKLVRVALGRIGELRREYVDPHVLRIYEKAIENSGSSHANPSNADSTVATVSESPISVGGVSNVNTNAQDPTIGSVLQPTPITPSTTVESIQPPIPPDTTDDLVEEPPTPNTPADPTPPATPEDTLVRAASVAEESAGRANSVIEEMSKEIESSEAEQILASITPTPEENPVPSATELPIVGTIEVTEILTQTSSQPVESPVAAEDLDNFLRDIGLNEDEVQIINSEPNIAPETVVDTVQPEEDEEARKAAVAAKRAEIVGRHVRWQSELDSLVRDLERRVVTEIQTIRQDAVNHIGILPSDKSGQRVEGKGKEVMDQVQHDGEKLLKGLEAYVKKLAGHGLSVEELEKEKEKWDKVLDKVEDKFRDVIRNVQEDVHNWYMEIRAQEIKSVNQAAQEAKMLADRAQADIGLDYAWLEDVTYQDWQNYHDLQRTYERFEQTALAMQNGTHVNAPDDNLTTVLNDLDQEVQDMIGGFAAKMNTFTREGDRLLHYSNPESDKEGEEQGREEEEEPQVSTLPIPPVPAPEDIDPANVIIGKSKEQIESLARQAVADGRIEL